MKNALTASLTLRAKVKDLAKIKCKCPKKQKTCLPKKFEQGSPRCDVDEEADADVDISKTICRPLPCGDGHNSAAYLTGKSQSPHLIRIRILKATNFAHMVVLKIILCMSLLCRWESSMSHT